MGKRSDFEHIKAMKYYTPLQPVLPLLPFVPAGSSFVEPCAGDGRLIRHLESNGLRCVYACDIEPEDERIEKRDVLLFGQSLPACDFIITNPPWERNRDGTGPLHQMIELFRHHAPTWLLFDAAWAQTGQSARFMKFCHAIIPVGRVKWIEGSDNGGKEDCSWYCFKKDPNPGFAQFYPIQ